MSGRREQQQAGWGAQGHSVNGGLRYNPDSAGFDYVGTQSSEGTTGSPAFYTDAGRPVYTVPAATGSAGVSNASGTIATAPNGGGTGPGSAEVGGNAGRGAGTRLVVNVNGGLQPDLKGTATQLLLGGDWWRENPWFSDADQWEQRYGEPGDWIGGAVTFAADGAYNAARGVEAVVQQAPTWNGASPSAINEPDPVYQDGWVSYDERQTWEKAPAGSPVGHWSF